MPSNLLVEMENAPVPDDKGPRGIVGPARARAHSPGTNAAAVPQARRR
jgi:hypothetical protein